MTRQELNRLAKGGAIAAALIGALLLWPSSAAQEKKPAGQSEQIEVMTCFTDTVRIAKEKGPVLPLHVECKEWHVTREENGTMFPEQGFYVAHLIGGVITTEIDGKAVQHVPGDFWTVEKGSRMVVKMKLHRETAIIQTISLSPIH